MRWKIACASLLVLTACQPAPVAQPPAAPAAAPTVAAQPTAAPQPTLAPTVAPTLAPTATAQPAQKLTIDLGADLDNLDPYLSYSPEGLSIHHNIFDYLVERDAQGKLAPGLAESWSVPDPVTLQFNLRKGVKFHNGEDFNADSVKASAERMLDQNLNSGVRSRFASIAEVRVVDPYTVQFVLSRPDATLLDSLSNQMAMLPAQVASQAGASPLTTPVGTGPYRFVEWNRGDHVTLEANTNYWSGSVKGQPKMKTVVFRPVPTGGTRLADLQSGQADMVAGLTPDQAKQLAAGTHLERTDLPGYQYIFFNDRLADTPLKDARVRTALNMAVDRASIIQSLLGATVQPLKAAVGPLTAGYDPSLEGFAYDPARARQLLTEAGASNLELTLDVAQPDRSDLIKEVAAQLAQVGVKVTIQTFDTAAFNDRWVAHNMHDLFFVRWATFADPGTLNLLASCNSFLSFFCSTAADPLLTQGGSTLDEAARNKAYAQALKELNDDPFALYLTTLSALYGVSDR